MPYPRLFGRLFAAMLLIVICLSFTDSSEAQLLRRIFRGKAYSNPTTTVCDANGCYEIPAGTYSAPVVEYSEPMVIESAPVLQPGEVLVLPEVTPEPVPLLLSNAKPARALPKSLVKRVRLWRELSKMSRYSPEARQALENPEIFNYLVAQENEIVMVYGGVFQDLLEWIRSDPEAFIAFLKELISLFIVQNETGNHEHFVDVGKMVDEWPMVA